MPELSIRFDNGDFLTLPIDKVIELDVSIQRKQSVEFRQIDKGWIMSYTKPLFQGAVPRKLKSITFIKDEKDRSVIIEGKEFIDKSEFFDIVKGLADWSRRNQIENEDEKLMATIEVQKLIALEERAKKLFQ